MTDCVSDIPYQMGVGLGITVVPLNVHFGSEIYRSRIDLTSDQFYDRLKRSCVLLVTSTPTPHDFTNACNKLVKETDEIIIITISNRLSGIYWTEIHGVGLV